MSLIKHERKQMNENELLMKNKDDENQNENSNEDGKWKASKEYIHLEGEGGLVDDIESRKNDKANLKLENINYYDEEDNEYVEITRLYKVDRKQKGRCIRIFTYTVVFVLVFLAISLFIFKQMGLFDNIERDIDIDDDGNAIEPNTKVKLPLVIESNVHIPGIGNRKVKQHLIGMMLKVREMLGLHLKILVLGFYVDWNTGKKVLIPWKGKKQDVDHPDPELIKILSDGETLPSTIRRVMTMTIPGSKMYDGWNKDLLEILKRENVDKKEIDEIEFAFHQWLSRPIHNHDHFDISWTLDHSLDDNIRHNSGHEKAEGQSIITFIFNDKVIQPIKRSKEMIHAITLQQLQENGGYLFNLLDLLWDHQSDSQDVSFSSSS